MSDVAQQVEDVRKALHNLSNDALCLRRAMGKSKAPPEQWEEWRAAMLTILANVKRAMFEGKYVSGEEDLLPWIKQRIEGLNLEEKSQ